MLCPVSTGTSDHLWAGIQSEYVTSQLTSALNPSSAAESSTSFDCGKGRNVTSVGWQVTLCGVHGMRVLVTAR